MLTCLRPSYEDGLARLHEALPDEKIKELWNRGLRFSLDEAVALAGQLRVN